MGKNVAIKQILPKNKQISPFVLEFEFLKWYTVTNKREETLDKNILLGG